MSDVWVESPPSIQFPWLDRHDFYRSGLPTRTLAGSFRERIPSLVQMHKTCWRLSEIGLCSVQKLKNRPERQGGLEFPSLTFYGARSSLMQYCSILE